MIILIEKEDFYASNKTADFRGDVKDCCVTEGNCGEV